MVTNGKLTRNETLVLETLREEKSPRTAYQLLELLRAEGLKAPLQIYRALNSLGERHLVHKLDSQNSFVACTHEHAHAKHTVIFLVCTGCGRADEVTDAAIDRQVTALTEARGFSIAESALEIHGLCGDCARAA